jgi:hypothetical protein
MTTKTEDRTGSRARQAFTGEPTPLELFGTSQDRLSIQLAGFARVIVLEGFHAGFAGGRIARRSNVMHDALFCLSPQIP